MKTWLGQAQLETKFVLGIELNDYFDFDYFCEFQTCKT